MDTKIGSSCSLYPMQDDAPPSKPNHASVVLRSGTAWTAGRQQQILPGQSYGGGEDQRVPCSAVPTEQYRAVPAWCAYCGSVGSVA